MWPLQTKNPPDLYLFLFNDGMTLKQSTPTRFKGALRTVVTDFVEVTQVTSEGKIVKHLQVKIHFNLYFYIGCATRHSLMD
jgi:hypothetical protein